MNAPEIQDRDLMQIPNPLPAGNRKGTTPGTPGGAGRRRLAGSPLLINPELHALTPASAQI
jgi:hypothetical protein